MYQTSLTVHSNVVILPRDAMHSADYDVTRCLCVGQSVTCRYSVEKINLFSNFSQRRVATIQAFSYKTA